MRLLGEAAPAALGIIVHPDWQEDDLTNDVLLIVTDFVDEDEKQATTDLWNTQITRLKHLLGS